MLIFCRPPQTRNFGDEVNWLDGSYLSISELQLILIGTEASKTHKKGTELISRGKASSKVLYIESGECTVEGMDSHGERIHIGTASKNQLVSLELLLANSVSTILISEIHSFFVGDAYLPF